MTAEEASLLAAVTTDVDAELALVDAGAADLAYDAAELAGYAVELRSLRSAVESHPLELG